MEGFILAAGLGTRLRPLTNDRPKALVEIPVKRKVESGEWKERNSTLLEIAIHRLEEAGIAHIVVNVHHFADKVIDFLHSRTWLAKIDISDERDLLFDTGGGLKKAAPLFSGEENVLVHNVDILSDIDLRDVEASHRAQGNLVTLCVSQRETKRMLEFGPDGLLQERADTSHPSPLASRLAFSGLSVVSPELFALLPEADHPYPVIDEYIRLSHEGHRIGCYRHSPERWLDVGKPETLALAQTLNFKP
ncbi:MAG: nucleotidyltransferase family protein [bacterium]